MEKNLRQTGIQKRSLAPKNAGVSTVGVVSIRPIGRASVYNMEVDGYHNFAVNGGLIVHNCMDEIRYFVNTVMVHHGGTTIGGW